MHKELKLHPLTCGAGASFPAFIFIWFVFLSDKKMFVFFVKSFLIVTQSDIISERLYPFRDRVSPVLVWQEPVSLVTVVQFSSSHHSTASTGLHDVDVEVSHPVY